MADQVFGVNSGFYDAVDYDRTYSAEDMNRPYSRIVADGVYAAQDGQPSSDLQVTAPGTSMNISVVKGQGIFGGKWFENPSAILITVPANTALYRRIDSVIVQIDKRVSGRVGSIVYRTGTPATTPEPPALSTNSAVVEYRVANISVTPSATKIRQADITDLRGSAACPWVTGLITQVSTATLWAQFQDAYAAQFDSYAQDYNAYIAAQRQAWEDFLRTLTDELTVQTNVISLVNTVTTAATVTSIPIGISAYEPERDILQVYINGLLATPEEDYTLGQGGTQITLASALFAGQTVVFVVFKAIASGDIASTVALIERVDGKVDEFLADTGWLALALAENIAAYNAASAPTARCVGGRVYLRGAVKGVSSTGTLLFVLPAGVRTAADLVLSSTAVTTSGSVKAVTISVEASTGYVKLAAGSVGATDRLNVTLAFLGDRSPGYGMIYRYMGTVLSTADLPTTGMAAGDTYTVQTANPARGIAAGDSVMWNGEFWELVTTAISDAEIGAIINTIT